MRNDKLFSGGLRIFCKFMREMGKQVWFQSWLRIIAIMPSWKINNTDIVWTEAQDFSVCTYLHF